VTAQREDQGSASPYPESVSRGEDGEVAHHRRNGDDAREDGMGDEGEGVRNGVGDEEEGFASMMGFGGFGTTKVSQCTDCS